MKKAAGLVLAVCLMFAFPVQAAQITVGASANDTLTIQTAINTVAFTGGGTVIIPAGTYRIDALASIVMRSNVALQMDKYTVLEALPNCADFSAVIKIADVDNVSVIGGTIAGDRLAHRGTTGEHGHGITILGSTNVTVSDIAANNCWGDGFYIGAGPSGQASENVRLANISADNNRRQGISIVSGKNIIVDGARITNTGGTDPGAAIDIEPNGPNDVIENIVIRNVTSANNKYGMLIYLNNFPDSAKVSVSIAGFQDTGSGWSLVASGITSIPNTDGVLSETTTDYISWTNTKNFFVYSASKTPQTGR